MFQVKAKNAGVSGNEIYDLIEETESHFICNGEKFRGDVRIMLPKADFVKVEKRVLENDSEPWAFEKFFEHTTGRNFKEWDRGDDFQVMIRRIGASCAGYMNYLSTLISVKK